MPAGTPYGAQDLRKGITMSQAVTAAVADDRPMWPAIKKGYLRRCPHCGEGALFDGYLKVNAACTECGEEFHHHRADDGPAYLTIVLVGKILGPLLYVAFTKFRPDPLMLSLVFSVAALAMSLYFLPRLKGALIGIQWSRRMHGFGRVAAR